MDRDKYLYTKTHTVRHNQMSKKYHMFKQILCNDILFGFLKLFSIFVCVCVCARYTKKSTHRRQIELIFNVICFIWRE